VVRGVYLDIRAVDDITTRARCLALRLPPGAAISRLTAAWLYGIDGRMPEQRCGPLVIECTVPCGREPLSRPGVKCYVAQLGDDVHLVDGVPCTSPERTAVDLLRWLSPHMGLAVADGLAARGLVCVEALPQAVERFRGASGVAQARHLAPVVEPLTQSFGESWTRLRMLDAGFPRPEAQIPILVDDHLLYCLDMGWRRRRLAVEYDGEEFHSSEQQRQRDLRRRDDLERRFGWNVLAVGKGEVLGRSMDLERAVGDLLGMAPRISSRRW
jgi:hypothetical protein